MRKVLIAYHHAGGTTQQMAGYIGEGIRINGAEADVKEIKDIDPVKTLQAMTATFSALRLITSMFLTP
jgi:flavodoxin